MYFGHVVVGVVEDEFVVVVVVGVDGVVGAACWEVIENSSRWRSCCRCCWRVWKTTVDQRRCC